MGNLYEIPTLIDELLNQTTLAKKLKKLKHTGKLPKFNKGIFKKELDDIIFFIFSV
ncbi:MAG: hypothetical protein AB1765_12145 [Candidatus Hydrogenedentota bacterium]